MSLAELPRPLGHAILTASFDCRELHNRLADLGLAPKDEREVHAVALRLLPRCRRLAAHLDTHLDRMYLDSLLLAWDSEESALLKWCRVGDYRRCACLGGMLWALARDSRSAVVEGASDLVKRIARDATSSQDGVAA